MRVEADSCHFAGEAANSVGTLQTHRARRIRPKAVKLRKGEGASNAAPRTSTSKLRFAAAAAFPQTRRKSWHTRFASGRHEQEIRRCRSVEKERNALQGAQDSHVRNVRSNFDGHGRGE